MHNYLCVTPEFSHINYWYLYLTSWSRSLYEKLIVIQLAKIFPTFYSTQKFIVVFTATHHWTLPCAI